MAIKKSKTYLDTNINGLVQIVEHNLGGIPDLFLTEIDAGKYKYVSLYDSRIAEIKALDNNNTQITFSSLFQGYLELLLVEVDEPTDHQRLISLEERYLSLLTLIESKTSQSQWVQMNNLHQAQLGSMQTQIDELKVQVELLSTDVEAL